MPYTKKRRVGKSTGTPMVRKVARQEVKKAVARDIETKIWEGNCAYTIPYTGINIPITYTYGVGTFPVQTSTLSQGTGKDDYIGDTIKPVRLEIRYAITYADAFNKIGIQLFQGRGSFLPSETDASSQWTGYGSGFAPISYVPIDYAGRLTKLARRTVVVDNLDNSCMVGVINITGKKLRKIKFLSSGAIETGEIFLSLISDSAAASHPGIEVTYRLHFKDA